MGDRIFPGYRRISTVYVIFTAAGDGSDWFLKLTKFDLMISNGRM